MDMRSKLFTAIFNYIDFTAPTKEVNESYLNILAEIHSDYCNMKNEISQLKRKNADLRFKNAELCEQLFKLSH